MPKLLNKHIYSKNLLVPTIFIVLFASLGVKLLFFSHASGLPPTVSVTAPVNNTLVCGTTTISANAVDNSGSGINNVQFKLDGANLGSAVTTAPYNYTWNTDAVSTDGSHSLSAVATDNDSNSTTSSPINVDVSVPGDIDCDGSVSGHDGTVK